LIGIFKVPSATRCAISISGVSINFRGVLEYNLSMILYDEGVVPVIKSRGNDNIKSNEMQPAVGK